MQLSGKASNFGFRVEGVFEASQGVAEEGAVGTTGAFGAAVAVFFGQGAGLTEELSGVFLQGAEAMLVFPLVLKSAQGQTETLAGEIGTAGPL